MVATSDEIRRELELTRERMGDTLAELERKLNPRLVIQNHPMAALGVAFGTGVVLGTNRKLEESGIRNLRTHLRNDHSRFDHSDSQSRARSNVVDELLDGIKSALLAAGTTKLGEFLDSLTRQYGSNTSITPRTPPRQSPVTHSSVTPGSRW